MKKADIQKELVEKGVSFGEGETMRELLGKLEATKVQVSASSLPYALFEAEDDEQILSEMQGAVLEKFVYSFDQGGKTIIGLSKAGVDNACRASADKKGEVYRLLKRKMPDGSEDFVQILDDGEYIVAKAVAERVKLIFDRNGKFVQEVPLENSVGVKRQWKKMKTRDGQIVTDPFYIEKATSKAIRNARLPLLPYTFIVELIKSYLGRGKENNVHVISNGLITDKQMRYIHAVASERGYSHERVKELVKQKFGYDNLSKLRMEDVSPLAKAMNDGGGTPEYVGIPEEIKVLFDAKSILSGKREAMWQAELRIAGGDVAKATEAVRRAVGSL